MHLQTVWEQYKGKGVVVLGFNSADSAEKTRELLEQKGADYPCIVEPPDAARTIAVQRYGSSSVPMNVILDREGNVALVAPGYSQGDERGLRAIEALLAGRKVETVRQPKSVFGQVLFADGKPLAGALVRLAVAGKRGTYRGTTDGDGRYEIADVPPGEYQATVQLVATPGFATPTGRVVVAADKAVEHAVRLGAGTIEGRVVLERTGKAPDHRDVSVSTQPGHYFATPDEKGRFKLIGLPPGTYAVRVSSSLPTLRSATREVELKGKKKSVTFKLESIDTGKLRLKVLDAAGKPARGLRFYQYLGEGSSRTLYGKYLDDGVWEFELEVGARSLAIQGHRGRIDVRIKKGKTTKKTVRPDG